MTIGERIREAREAAGWTQREAAERAKIPQPCWSRYEAGHVEPRLDMIRRMARAIGTTAIELIWD